MRDIIIVIIVLMVLGLILNAQSKKINPDRFQSIPVVPPEPKPPWFGASVGELIQQSSREIHNFLFDLKRAGGNATEIFLVHSHDGNTFQPYAWDGESFYLNVWNEAFWNKFRFFLKTCKELGGAVFIKIHDRCSTKNPELAKYYCFLNNAEGFTDVYDAGLHQYYSKLNKRILKELEDVGIEKFFIIPMNETDGESDEVYYFNQWYVFDLWSYGIPQDQIILSADPRHFDRLQVLECRLEIHDIASTDELVTAITLYGGNIFGNGDGCHGEGICSWNGYCEPSLFQAEMLGSYIRYNNLFGYLYKLRSAYKVCGEINMTNLNFQALESLMEIKND